MGEAKYLAFDTETGGLISGVALLTSHFLVLDNDLKVLDELELTTKPNNGHYVIAPEALEVNKINLIEHHKI